MVKITFLGAGSTIFAKNLIGDIFLNDSLRQCRIALYDIDRSRLEDSALIIGKLNEKINSNKAVITTHLGKSQRGAALKKADYVINAIQVGGYKPSTIIDFEIPKKYRLRQTIGDTLGVGGIFRALRTSTVLLEIAAEMEKLCPNALFLNYVNPMAIITGILLKGTSVRTVGLCHSVQKCVSELLSAVKLQLNTNKIRWKIAGINHMAWLLEISESGKDLYPIIKQKALIINELARSGKGIKHNDMIRLEIMRHFGYYITESSEHNAEYTPYWIKFQFPELITEFNIPLDEYPRRCENQIQKWNALKKQILKDTQHQRSMEYCVDIINAVENNIPFGFNGNVLNNGLIPNLPADCVVEVPCLANQNGVTGCFVGNLPPQCAALNMTNINVQLLTMEAILNNKKDYVYQAAMLDPHTASELTLDKIKDLCDDMFDAHGKMLPKMR
ncbi:MAG: alpha-glucosidase/alpha-galactosidase [Planctomycetes bacterium GWF2_41_51]|nr:MAG: alpha-glucosidase/alpha-galactosidase [Planctomycetes bacterium GWF2_41_51]HBG26520.1 alpha-glucosidase/alpha-galactosidase [Phycisphaerales bacterium]